MERNDIKALPLAAVGLALGVFEVFIKPAAKDLGVFILSKMITFEPIDFDAIDAHIREISADL